MANKKHLIGTGTPIVSLSNPGKTPWTDRNRFNDVFARPFKSKIKKGVVEFHDRRGLVFIFKGPPYDPDKHADIVENMVATLNGQEAEWFGIEKRCHFSSLVYGFSFGPFATDAPYDPREKYSYDELNSILAPYIAYHAFKGTSDYAKFLLERFYSFDNIWLVSGDKADKIAYWTLLENKVSNKSLTESVGEEVKRWRKIVIVEYVFDNLDRFWSEGMKIEPSPGLEERFRTAVTKYFSQSIVRQEDKAVRQDYLDEIFSITQEFPIHVERKRQDFEKQFGFYDKRTERYYPSPSALEDYRWEHGTHYGDIVVLPVDFQNSIWAFQKPEYMFPDMIEKLKYRDERDGACHRLFREHVFRLDWNTALGDFWQYCNKNDLSLEEFGLGVPFPFPGKKKTHAAISEYVSACLLVMGIMTKPSTIGRFYSEYSFCANDAKRRGQSIPEKVSFFTFYLKQLIKHDYERRLVVPEAWDYEFVPDDDFTKRLFQID